MGLAIAYYSQAAAMGSTYGKNNLRAFRVPVPRAFSTNNGGANGSFQPDFASYDSRCAAQGGIGSDSYCYKGGKQIDVSTGAPMEQNEAGYVNQEEVENESEGRVEESGGGYESGGGGYESGGGYEAGGGYESGGGGGFEGGESGGEE